MRFIMHRTLYVDGSNLYGGMSELLPAGDYIDFSCLVAILEKDLSIGTIKFYATYMKFESNSPTTHQLTAKAQVEFLNSAKQHLKVQFHKGYFSGSNKEKGIDMRLGLDMYIDARNGNYDEAILMSGDADFNYAVDKILDHGKKVHMMAFASRYPFGMASRADKKFVYDYNGHFTNRIIPSMKRPPTNLQIKEIATDVKTVTVKLTQ